MFCESPSHMLQGRGIPKYCAMFIFFCYVFIEFPLKNFGEEGATQFTRELQTKKLEVLKI